MDHARAARRSAGAEAVIEPQFRSPARRPTHVARIASVIAAIGVFVLGAVRLEAAEPRAGKLPRLAVLEPGLAPGASCLAGFFQGMRELGYIDGKTVTIDLRYADNSADRLGALAADIVRHAPNVFWTHSSLGARAAARATKTIPVVSGIGGDLVAHGLVASLARPGGNVTGFELIDQDLAGKRLQLLKEALPSVTRVAVLVDPSLPSFDIVPRNIQKEAQLLGVRLQRVEAKSVDQFEAAFAAIARERADALMVTDNVLFARNAARIYELALKHRLPTISGWRRYATAGSLISYGANVDDSCRRSVSYVDKILKGAKPGELPVQLPDRFELIVNRRTAAALGVTIAPAVMVQASEVLE